MSGFRSTSAPLSAKQRERRATRPGIVQQVVEALQHGQTVAEVSRDYGLPREFVEQIVEHARATGSLTMVKLSAQQCGTGSCNPDPSSLICAGCPLAPAGAANRMSISRAVHRLAAKRPHA